MKKAVLYLETSVFGFYFDEEPQNISNKVEQARPLQIQYVLCSGKVYFAYTFLYREKFLSLIEENNVKELEVDEDEVEKLAQKYINEKVIPEEFMDDARHVASATVAKVDLLVSLNLEHIVNEWTIRKINGVNLREGYPILNIRLPEEVVVYED